METFYPNSDKYPNTDADMNQRNWLVNRWTPSLIYAAIILIPVPMLLVKAFALQWWLPVLMALGPILIGIWHLTTFYCRGSIDWSGKSIVVGVAVGIGAALVILIGSGSWFSYSFLKSGWFIIMYALFGLTPVIAYAWMLQRLLAMRPLGLTLWLGFVSLLAPWFWAGFAVYAAYHAL